MKDFVDKTANSRGTPVNRAAMMAIQGFDGKTIVFNADGSITETNTFGETKTIRFDDNRIIETFTGEKTITKTTYFDENGTITEVLS